MGGLLLESASPGIDDEVGRVARGRLDEERALRLQKEGIESFVDAWLALPLFRGVAALPPARQERAREVRVRQDAGRMAAWLRGGGTGSQPSYWGELSRIRCPVHLLTGAEDEKFTGLAARMADSMPDATVTSIPGVGHLPHLEAPERWTEWVRRALESDRPSPPSEGVGSGEGE
jgi:2-succinyl-6-hydroxy-2,4-cyclohexadiene-1-carboxylate synthase